MKEKSYLSTNPKHCRSFDEAKVRLNGWLDNYKEKFASNPQPPSVRVIRLAIQTLTFLQRNKVFDMLPFVIITTSPGGIIFSRSTEKCKILVHINQHEKIEMTEMECKTKPLTALINGM